MTARALWGVLYARLYAQRRLVVASWAGALIVGLLAPPGPGGAVLFCSLVGVGLALAQTPGLNPHLDRCEQGAPLFGRELARAKALVPCAAVGLAVLLYAIAQIVRGAPDAALTFVVAFAAVVTATLIALSATVRRGVSRALYVLLAAAASAGAYGLAVAAHSVLGELAYGAVIAFLAVRQYGETLARYDPI